jgi:glucokinase
MTPDLLAGVDVGGTKIAVGLADGEGRIIASRRAATTRQGGREVIGQIIALLKKGLAATGGSTGAAAIGVAVPAVIDQARGVVVWAPNIAGWQHEVAVAQPISEALGLPVTLHYDGQAWVTGEWWCGAGRGARDVALVAVGTGIGGGLILGGLLHRGRVGVAGAVGWWVADWRQVTQTRPASLGWLESLASGPAIARAAGRATAEDALQAARAGDGKAQQAVAQAAEVLGAAAANIVSLVDPEVVVMAGGVIAGGGDLLLPRIREIVRREAQPQVARQVRIAAAELGEDAAWLGAAKLAQQAREEGAL